jgi:serine/threonine-protein kinase
MGGVADGPDQSWQLGTTANTDGTLTTVSTKVDGPTACQRALTAVNNVVIDVSACLPSPVGDQGATIAHQIAERVPR